MTRSNYQGSKVTLQDIPEDILQHIKDEFENSPDVRELRAKQQLAQRRGNWATALQIAKAIDTLFTKVVDSLIMEAQREVEHVELKTKDFSIEQRQKMVEIIVTMFMCCDMLETAVTDFNDVIHAKDKTVDLDMFDEFLKLKDKARAKLEYFSKHSTFMKDFYWGERCDNMYDMLRHKAASILRHNAEQRFKGMKEVQAKK